MASTPSPGDRRIRTPPTPMHGPLDDNYEPYSPRRSKRSTALNHPYSSFNGDASLPGVNLHHNLTPPATFKKARFAQAPTQLSSPPSSPPSPARSRLHKTPRKQSLRSEGIAGLSDSEHPTISLTTHPQGSATMLPTPSKTPKKRHFANVSSTARILNFQPSHLNDVMPSPRSKMKRHPRMNSTTGFELYDDDAPQPNRDIPVFTDSNARVPELDNTEDNPFVGPKQTDAKTHRRSSRRQDTEEAACIEKATKSDEGVVYVFRGKKIFRKFQDAGHDGSSASSNSFDNSQEQRKLKRQAGVAATRPLTRSSIKPRLLFPSHEQEAERETRTNEVDEEAVTDIEMPSPSTKAKETAKIKGSQVTPQTSNRATRSSGKHAASIAHAAQSSMDDDAYEMGPTTPDDVASGTSAKKRSPFDAWPRTKLGRKRPGESAEDQVHSGKRTRNAAVDSSV